MKWNSNILDTLIAPGISTFRAANIPDIAGRFPQAEHWLGNHFLNNFFRGSFADDRARQLAMGFLRRAQLAHVAYRDARRLTLAYLDGNDPDNPRIGPYYEAIARWEQFAIEISIALDIFRWLNHLDGGPAAFVKGDGSDEDRIYDIANKVKHAGEHIARRRYGITFMVPLWLTDDGLNAIGTLVTFQQAFEIISEMAELADRLQDPKAFAEQAKADATRAAGTPAPIPPGTSS